MCACAGSIPDRPERTAARLGYLGDPRSANTSPAGLGRYSSLRSSLSQWSYDLSNAKGPKNAPRIRRTLVLQVENLADDAVRASHDPAIRSALATQDKEYIGIEYTIIGTSLLGCANPSMRYWIGAAAKDCLQTDDSPGASCATPRAVVTPEKPLDQSAPQAPVLSTAQAPAQGRGSWL
jgi:hypothetical protein